MAYDCFFLSYDEPHAPKHWQSLLKVAPHARHVSGIAGILKAHQECARRARTNHFFVVDGDSEMLDFDFAYRISPELADYVHLWYARNPVNGLEYGWGGLKLFPRRLLLRCDQMPFDLTGSLPVHHLPQVVSITHFNTSARNAWRAAFREAVKLSVINDDEAQQRLAVWCEVAKPVPYAQETKLGAQMGRAYGEAHRDAPDNLAKINDYEWLHRYFEQI